MRPIFTLLAGAAILFCSCSASHKVQNSDDPGYSSPSGRSSSGASQSDYYSTAPSDNYVRMKTTDQARWSTFDDNNDYDNYYAPTPLGASPYYGGYGGFGYSPYAYGFGYGMGYGFGMYGFSAMSIGLGFWDPYFGWNSYFMWNCGYNPYFYNPYYGGSVAVIKSGGAANTAMPSFYNRMPAFNASTYHSTGFVNGNGNRFYRPSGTPLSSSSPYNNGTGRRFNNGSNNSFYRPGNNTPNSSPRPMGGSGSFGGGQSRSFSPPSGGGGSGFGGGGMSRGFSRH
jgi:hypothetical protein